MTENGNGTAPPTESEETQSRRKDFSGVLARMNRPFRLGLISDVEGGLILTSALQSYIDGNDVSAIIASHASSERDLLSRAFHWRERGEPTPPKNFERWGLGGLIEFYRTDLPSDLVSRLERLNDRRKTLYHYGYADTAAGIRPLTYGYVEQYTQSKLQDAFHDKHARFADPKELLDFATGAMLREFALESVGTAAQTREWAVD